MICLELCNIKTRWQLYSRVVHVKKKNMHDYKEINCLIVLYDIYYKRYQKNLIAVTAVNLSSSDAFLKIKPGHVMICRLILRL